MTHIEEAGEILDAATGVTLRRFETGRSPLAVSYDRDGKRFAVSQGDDGLGVHAASGELVGTVKLSFPMKASFSADGERIACADLKGGVTIVKVASLAVERRLPLKGVLPAFGAFSPVEARLLATRDSDGLIELHDLAP
ncbi:MAG: YncE family protein [Planctomycetota bacterium]